MTVIFWKIHDIKVINALCNNLGIRFCVSVNRTTVVNVASLSESRRRYLRRCVNDGLCEVRIRK